MQTETAKAVVGLMKESKDHLLSKTFPATKGCRGFRSITIRELDGNDELVIAANVDSIMDEMGGEWSFNVANELKGREAIKLAIVEIDGKPAHDEHGGELFSWTEWNRKTRTIVGRWFGQLNALDDTDMEKADAGEGTASPTRRGSQGEGDAAENTETP